MPGPRREKEGTFEEEEEMATVDRFQGVETWWDEEFPINLERTRTRRVLGWERTMVLRKSLRK